MFEICLSSHGCAITMESNSFERGGKRFLQRGKQNVLEGQSRKMLGQPGLHYLGRRGGVRAGWRQ